MIALRRGRFRDPGLRTRGPLGLGTEFESVRDYLPDDDVRQINWHATHASGRPMSNQYRVEQDRDVVCLLDVGPADGAPLRSATLDTRLDARGRRGHGGRARRRRARRPLRRHRRSTPRSAAGCDRGAAAARAVVQAILDVEPRVVDSDYDLAFRAVGGGKRGLVIVFTDLVDEAAARSLLAAVPVLDPPPRGRRRVGHAIPISTARSVREPATHA